MLSVERCAPEVAQAVLGDAVDVRNHIELSEVLLCIGAPPVAVIGAIRVTALSNKGYLWMMGTADLTLFRMAFARSSRGFADKLFETFDVLVGVSFLPSSVRWLTWLGCEYGDRLDNGGLPFTIRKPEHG